jgi:hypothetical protein
MLDCLDDKILSQGEIVETLELLRGLQDHFSDDRNCRHCIARTKRGVPFVNSWIFINVFLDTTLTQIGRTKALAFHP